MFYFFFAPSYALARTSVNVPTGDPVYRIIDRLVAAGMVKNIIVGQRPYTRLEIASILKEAKDNFDGLESPTQKLIFLRLLDYWLNRYEGELAEVSGNGDRKLIDARPLSTLDMRFDYLGGAPRLIPVDNSGGVDASVNPLVDYRGGRIYSKGGMLSFETEHWLSSPYFAFLIHPRLQGQISYAGFPEDSRPYIQNLYAKMGVKNIELEVGRDEIVWGAGEQGGLMFTNHARPLDMFKFSTLQPARLPWIFKYFGNVKYSLLVANLGPEYNFSYAYLTGMKFSMQPVHFAEIGLAYDVILGGRGGPDISFGNGVREFFGFIPGVSRGGRYSLRLGGIDFRFRIPPASGLELYGEAVTTNFDSDKMAYLGGAYLPRLGRADHFALRGEFLHTPAGFYRSTTYASGYTLSHEILGHPLGPGADAGYLTVYYDMGVKSLLRLDAAVERYRGGPSEVRYRGLLGLNAGLYKRSLLKLGFGAEYVQDYNFTPKNSRTNVFGMLGLTLDFGPMEEKGLIRR